MDNFFKKHSDLFDEVLAFDVLNRGMSNFQNEQNPSRGGQSSRHQDEGYEYKYKELAKLHEMIEDFFEAKGMDLRSFYESSRRGR